MSVITHSWAPYMWKCGWKLLCTHMHIFCVYIHVCVCSDRIYSFVVLCYGRALACRRAGSIQVMFWPDLNSGVVCQSNLSQRHRRVDLLLGGRYSCLLFLLLSPLVFSVLWFKIREQSLSVCMPGNTDHFGTALREKLWNSCFCHVKNSI